jgi:hypothetical protein
VRVRVAGYRKVEGDVESESVVYEARLLAADGARYAISLARRCVDTRCPGGQTCDPSGGACAPVQELTAARAPGGSAHCATVMGGAPSTLGPSITTEVGCGVGGCGARYAEACGDTTFCADNWTCAQGVCCDGPCDGTCSRCDITEHRGECWPVDYGESSDVQHCGACNAACGASNAFGATCEEGSCVYQCRNGYADCNADGGPHDGCEQNIETDPAHCGACGEVCRFGFCHDFLCAAPIGYGTGGSFYDLSPGVAGGTRITIAHSATVLALGGALQNLSQPSAHVRFGLYEQNVEGIPSVLRAQTSVLDVVEFVEAEEVSLSTLTVAPIAPTVVLPGAYWIVVESDKAVRVMSEGGLVSSRFLGGSIGVEPFTDILVGTVSQQEQPLDLMVFLTESQEF